MIVSLRGDVNACGDEVREMLRRVYSGVCLARIQGRGTGFHRRLRGRKYRDGSTPMCMP